MSILKIAKIGHPCLRRPNRALTVAELRKEPVQRFIDDMLETMRDGEGIGLAAPQVHENLQLVVIELSKIENSEKKEIPPLVLANPSFSFLAEERVEGWEGCLSIDNLRGRVPRSKRVAVKYLDRKGEARTLDTQTFLAVVLQHELDHLAGKLYPDRMTDMTKLAHLAEFRRFVLAETPDETE
ncbi:MAG: peptide deformylase [Planctomycetes bacterium]|nr:peptide deformylase [Planctomycetota bacterium]